MILTVLLCLLVAVSAQLPHISPPALVQAALVQLLQLPPSTMLLRSPTIRRILRIRRIPLLRSTRPPPPRILLILLILPRRRTLRSPRFLRSRPRSPIPIRPCLLTLTSLPCRPCRPCRPWLSRLQRLMLRDALSAEPLPRRCCCCSNGKTSSSPLPLSFSLHPDPDPDLPTVD